jgi:D-glycero-alpha-D-manno-heptose-7-phosphate kinase
VTSWVRAQAPVRILDAGGWTDTWFAERGAVCHLCVGPGAEAYAGLMATSGGDEHQVHLRVPDFHEEYAFCFDRPPGRHPLLEAALQRWAPPGCSLEVTVSSGVPPGSSLGTSAAVLVALVAALQSLAGVRPAPAALARAAHDVETVDLGRQSGVQDQVAAAFGGANRVAVQYPRFEVDPLRLSPTTWEALSRRVVTVYLGSHDSSAVHGTVIGGLGHADGRLQPLRDAAARAAAALAEGDLGTYGEAMAANTAAQAALHPSLVNPDAQRVIDVAAGLGAAGWKVNGAGGAGGTVSVIGPDDPGELLAALGGIEGLTVLHLCPASQGARIVDEG